MLPGSFDLKADGSYRVNDPISGIGLISESRWRLGGTSLFGDRVTIVIDDTLPAGAGTPMRLTFVFDEPDVIRVVEGPILGVRYEREK